MIRWHYTQIFLHIGDITDSDYPNMVALSDNLLLNCIAPVLHQFQPYIKMYFFLRYNDSGYHLRLRIQADEVDYHNHIHPALVANLTQFRDQHTWLQAVPMDVFIQNANYEPEWDKFGGQAGMELAEHHFQVSSDIALTILRLEHEKGIHRSVFALIIMKALMYQITPNPAQVSALLFAYIRYWLVGKDETQALPLLQQHALAKQAILAQTEKMAQHPLVQTWLSQLQAGVEAFFKLEVDGKLDTSIHHYLHEEKHKITPALPYPITTLLIVPNLIHLFQNRLGISTTQETQLASILYFNQQPPVPPITLNLILEPLAFDWLHAYHKGISSA